MPTVIVLIWSFAKEYPEKITREAYTIDINRTLPAKQLFMRFCLQALSTNQYPQANRFVPVTKYKSYLGKVLYKTCGSAHMFVIAATNLLAGIPAICLTRYRFN